MTIKKMQNGIMKHSMHAYWLQINGDKRGERTESMKLISETISQYIEENGDESVGDVCDYITKLNDDLFFNVVSSLRNNYPNFLYRYLLYLKKIAYVG